MKRALLLSVFLLSVIVASAQLQSIRPNNGFRGQTLTTTITSAWGVLSGSSGPYNYQDIFLQQGSTIIYCDPSFNPSTNIYNNGWGMNYDSLYCIFNIPGNTPTGLYDVHMYTYDPWNGNTIDNTLANGFLIQGGYAGDISGTVYFDLNQNGVNDAGDLPLSNQRVLLSPSGLIAFTDTGGHYTAMVDTGTFTVSPILGPGYSQTSLPLTYSVTTPPSSAGNDFGLYSNSALYTKDFYVLTHPMRCDVHGYSYVLTSNTGLFPLDGKITIIHSANLPFVSSNPMPNQVNGDTLIWTYSNLHPGQSFNLGSSGWITYQDPPAGQTIWYTVIDSVFDTSGILKNVYSMSWSFVVNCSCDPNEKDVSPVGIGANHYTPMNDYLYYTLNFQNTGNDTAFNVHIVDTISSALDLNSLEIVGSSDPVHAQMSSTGVVDFFFDNILLPDSNIDEPGSHGFVAFRIMPNSGLPDPTVINNTGYIYFDFNSAVITNTTLNTLTNLQYPDANFNAAGTSVCATNCIQFANQIQPGTTYQWSFPGGNPSSSTDPQPQVCYFNAGHYDVTLIATNALGSDTMSQPSYIEVLALPTTPVVTQVGDSLISNTGYAAYQWYYMGNPLPGETSSSMLATQDGDYALVVTNANGCQTSVAILNVVTGIADDPSLADARIYPNPSDGNFEVQYLSSGNSSTRIEIVNAAGQIIQTEISPSQRGKNKFEMNNIPQGVYTLRLISESKTIIKKLIIER